jgi:hypothetical protein
VILLFIVPEIRVRRLLSLPEKQVDIENDSQQQAEISDERPEQIIPVSLSTEIPITRSPEEVEDIINEEKPGLLERAEELGQKIGIRKGEGTWKIIAGGIAAILAGGTAFYFIQRHRKKKESEVPENIE